MVTSLPGERSWQTDLTQGFDQMQATGLPIFIGEFGPGKNVGPSPTMVTPGTIDYGPSSTRGSALPI